MENKELTSEKSISQRKRKTGKNISANSLSHKLSRESISFKEVINIADELGYDVIFKPRSDWE